MVYLPGELSPDLDELYLHFVSELTEGDPELPTVEQLIQMFKRCSINRICVELKSLRGVASFGDYRHPDSQQFKFKNSLRSISSMIAGNFETMQGNLEATLGKMLRQCFAIGRSVAEIVLTSSQKGYEGEVRLYKLKVLNPCRYSFAGYGGEWDRVIYKGINGAYFPIPREKLLHIYIPSIEEPENPLGDALGARAYPYYKAKEIAVKNWNRQLAKNSRGITIFKGDTSDNLNDRDSEGNIIYDSTGQPKKKPSLQSTVNLYTKIQEGDAFGIDKKIEHYHIPGTSGTGADYNLAITNYTNHIFYTYGIPTTILAEGSATLGQSGLNYGHRLIFDSMIEPVVTMLRNELLEKVIKNLLVANLGISQQEELGNFISPTFLSPETSGIRVSNIMSASFNGLLDVNDLEVINRVRADCGLSNISEERYNQIQIQKLLADQQEQPY